MKKILYLLTVLSILSSLTLVESASVFNTASGVVYTDIAFLQTSLVNQNPSTADPGSYVDLLFKIENWGTESAENVTFELLPTYPFSLDPGVSTVNNIGTINGLQSGNDAYLVRYKLKVDKDAVNGDNEIKLKYSDGDGSSYSIVTFNVSVSNSRTDFDIVVQDSTDTSTTMAIANIGANSAYSTIVKIPQQENFRVSGTSASIIGNLDAGDYTLVSFQIVSTSIVNTSDPSKIPPTRMSTNVSMSRNRNITVEISYTDILGIRRTVQKQVSFDITNGTTTSTLQRTQSSSSLLGNGNLTNSGLTYIAIGVVGIVIIVAILKIRKRKKK
jgi:hypothetical protein